jgi:hypothetical protein
VFVGRKRSGQATLITAPAVDPADGAIDVNLGVGDEPVSDRVSFSTGAVYDISGGRATH